MSTDSVHLNTPSKPPAGAGRSRGRGRFAAALSAMVLAGVAARIAVVAAVPTQPASDCWSYLQRARNLLHHGHYGAFLGRPDATYPPGYPLLLAAALAPVSEENSLLAAKLAGCLLAGAAIGLCGTVGRRAFGPAAGLLAAGWLAIYPRHILQATVLLSEHVFLPLLLLFFLAVLSAQDHPRPWRWVLIAGLAAGCLGLIRPVAYLLPPVWLWRLTRKQPCRRVVGELLVLVLVQHLVMLPWAVRNLRTLGTFSFLSAAGGVDLFIGNNPHATGKWMPWRAALVELAPAAGHPNRGDFELAALARRAALRWILKHPLAALRLYLHKLRLIFGSEEGLVTLALTGQGLWPPLGGIEVLPRGHPAVALAPLARRLMNGSSGLLLALVVSACLFALWPRTCVPGELWPGWLAITLAAYFPLVAAAFHASTRYRWPAEELCIPVAAFALVRLAGFSRCRAVSRQVL